MSDAPKMPMDRASSALLKERRAAWRAGARAAAPFLFGTVPFGLVTGIATKTAGLSLMEAVGMTLMVFAGTAQLAALPLIQAGAPALIIIATAFIINLRFLIYSASVAPHFATLPWRRKLLLGYFLTDTGFALFTRRVSDKPDFPHQDSYFLGAGMLIASVWIASTLTGIFAGSQVPKAWQLEFAATLGILALLAPFVRGRAEFSAAFVSGAVALITYAWPMRLGLITAALAGIAAGVMAQKFERAA
jgi:4-azaleucine resistance transporter AzlC